MAIQWILKSFHKLTRQSEGKGKVTKIKHNTLWNCRWLVVAGVPDAGLEVVKDESGEAVKGHARHVRSLNCSDGEPLRI